MTMGLPDFTKATVLVMGDVMLDRYWIGDTQRISPEAPVPVVHVQSIDERPGGAGNVALNLASIGVQTDLLGLIGVDAAGQSLQKKLVDHKIACRLEQVSDHHTITKLRVLSTQQQLIRLDFENKFNREQAKVLHNVYHDQLAQAKAVILSDYGKGSLTDVNQLIQQAKQKNVPVLIDPKGKEFDLYRGATLLTPNLKEFEVVMGKVASEADLADKAIQAIEQYDLQAILVTRGSDGMSLFALNQAPVHLKAHSQEVFDVTGAGDTVIAILAAALAAGADLTFAVKLANLAAGIVVSKVGTATVTLEELQQKLIASQSIPKGLMTESQLLTIRKQAALAGQRVVFTNGCFDILHVGHITYLQQAKALGDKLIVAVNSDESVKQLKGPTRPLNPLEQRMMMLAALESVDWVVSFSEETPKRLIEAVLPDVLVKGGDYQVADIAGSDAVLANQGEVKVLSFVEGCSTTGLVEKIKATSVSE